jgi:hypothetical protein
MLPVKATWLILFFAFISNSTRPLKATILKVMNLKLALPRCSILRLAAFVFLLPAYIFGADKLKVGDLIFTYPSTWLLAESTSPFRAATLRILEDGNVDQNVSPERELLERTEKAKELEQALTTGDEKILERLAEKATSEQLEKLASVQTMDAVFFYFGTSGPSADAEAQKNRWLAQFQGETQSKSEDVEADGKKVTLISMTGTYIEAAKFGQKTLREDYTLLGAIIPAPDAPVFIRLVGPKAAVERVAGEFRKLSISPFAR